MNLANKFTTIRICMVPFYVLLMGLGGFYNMILAFVVFFVAAVTDFFDGQIARKSGTVTPLGIFLDPLADKLLTSAAFIWFVGIPMLGVSPWMVITIILRDFIITGFRFIAVSQNATIAADKSGKFKTVSQLVVIMVIMVILVINEALLKFAGATIDILARDCGDYCALAVVMKKAPFWAIFCIVIFTVLSGLNYMWKYRNLLSQNDNK
ncbi:MAG: CDP-diacylglycerol--glycerol-3-phosphate 3-phosphatidyltransferase [Endomicrobium sp.]|jgi:CDP-diacylglycerol--glycerol-3-phosphate 3-phosphatidyltransferase|nr:CDP-diacylglycerol--glycerol-3-phosphate 3-phosphatidyltransferase [Endomicrobium sp.]